MVAPQQSLDVVPRPQSVQIERGQYVIPDDSVIAINPGGREMRFSASLLSKSLRSIGKRAIVITSNRKGEGSWLHLSEAGGAPDTKKPAASLGSEGYALEVGDGIDLRANTAAGIFYGVQTIIQAAAAGQGTLPNCQVTDKPAMSMRGVMADLARLKEKDEYYFKLVDFISQYKFNTIFLHLSDDQGCPIELKKHPKLSSDYALSHETVGKLVAYAAERHVDVIPEMEVWGHAHWVTSHPEYADLDEERGDLCTTNPKTWKFVADIFDEICEVFPSKYIHGGSDEARFGNCPNCKAVVEEKGALYLVGEHVKRTAEIIHERGRIPIIWADILLNYPGSEEIVPQYTILNHWDYVADLSDEPVKYLQSKGFTVLGGSGIVQCSRAVLPKADAFDNVEKWGVIARKYKLPGINHTIWVPQRYFSDTLWYTIAMAGEASWSDGTPDRDHFTHAFFKSFFGVDAGTDLMDAVATLHDIPAYVGDWIVGVWKDKKQFDELIEAEVHAQKEGFAVAMADVPKTLKDYKPEVTMHKWEYAALIHASEMKKHIAGRSAAPGRVVYAIDEAKRLFAEGKPAAASKLLALKAKKLSRLAENEKKLAGVTEKYWDKWRYEDDPKKSNPFQNVLSAFKTSDGYITKMAQALDMAAEQLADGKEPEWEGLFEE